MSRGFLEQFAQDGDILIDPFVNSGVAAFQITLSVLFSAFASGKLVYGQARLAGD